MAEEKRRDKELYFICGYDALNHLLEQETRQGEDSLIHKKYTYDKRGNLTGEYQDGRLLHGYVYDSMNRLQRAWDSQGAEAEYFYNALGHRTGRSAGGQMEEYLLDLTRPYHNLLELRRGNRRKIFYWDMNVSAVEDENRVIQYYLSDELGSPLRVLYQNGNGDAYGYDEFGVDLYDPEAEQYGGNRYSRQGECQPFGYTGYRHDDISGTYFAQAREYQPELGRFVAEDVVWGNGADTKILNHYQYCLNNPVLFVDLNGLYPEWLDGIYAHIQFEMLFLLLYSESYQYRYADNIYGKANVYIPGSGKTGGKGFADVVLYTSNDVQIYEIKPQSYYNDQYKKKSGEDQLKRYISTYNKNGNNPGAISGQEDYVDTILNKQYKFWFDSKRTIVYEMHEDSPGMIYYKLESKGGQKQTVPEPEPEPELDETTENLLTVLIMTTAILTGKGAGVEGLPVMIERQENEFLLDKDTQNFLAMILMGSAATAEKAAEIGSAVIDGLFFLPIPDVLLENFMRTGSGSCDA